ncbi:hypothetical protein [Bradyrhizobium sp. AUGA SZCCT0042]|uniref:hypothetical protein n=1 Tax=Bradyrhizobium sp. AUGA SZCCT0042 TaxID=2807651 RepID=UPI001BAA4359|nr:hypothetical protein [Bradyrhizobium sp. AUGA SZCCT0042]MBR1299484.1 hypothetical protein [Bradyrhizobium sp. AUGA SZCCT0042]
MTSFSRNGFDETILSTDEAILVIWRTLPETIVRHTEALLNKQFHQTSGGILNEVEHAMLSEKFFLLLETLRSEAERSPTYSDGSTRVISTSPHVPVQLPAADRK